MNADRRVMEYMPKRLGRDESDAMAAKIREHHETYGFGLWALEVPGAVPFIGFVGLSRPRFEAHFTPCVEIAWRLAHESWGQGYATEAAIAVLAVAFGALEFGEIVSFTVPGNARSRAVMERIGMTRRPEDEFEHPGLPAGHALRPHVLYRLSKGDYTEARP